jgi:hypothetical protein
MSKWGIFVGEVETGWLEPENEPDRDMRLLKDFSFMDPANKIWRAPQGSVINGASIPRSLWTLIGSPYSGDYRRASVVHDVACGLASVPRKAADRMFYFACREGGCTWFQARVLYIGVRIGAWIANNPDLRQIEDAGPTYGPFVMQTREDQLVVETYQRAYYLTEDLKDGSDLALIDTAVSKSASMTLNQLKRPKTKGRTTAKLSKK